MDQIKKKKVTVSGAYNEIALIKNYLETSNCNIYELLQMWDFKKNNTIVYRHMKDALSVRGFKFDPIIRDLILNVAPKYVVEDNENHMGNVDLVSINYESLCLDFV